MAAAIFADGSLVVLVLSHTTTGNQTTGMDRALRFGALVVRMLVSDFGKAWARAAGVVLGLLLGSKIHMLLTGG